MALFLFVLASSAFARKDLPIVYTFNQNLESKTPSLNPEYLVFSSPQGSSEKVPLLIYLHGAGGTGDQIEKIKGQAMRVWKGLQKFNKGTCIVVAPQCRKRWVVQDLNLFLQNLKANFPVDSRRIYLTGNSMGGYGTWAWAAHSPEHFAAIAPVVGGIGPKGPKDVTPDLAKWAAKLTTVPVYAFAGAKDKVVPAERSERMILAIREAGGKKAKLKIYSSQGHAAGRVVFSTSDLYDWMFDQQRENSKRSDN